MTEIVERLLQDFQYHASGCEFEVCYEDKLCKIKRCEYLPDSDGKVFFLKEDKWSNDGYTIVEAVEFLNKFKDSITDILFETYNGSYQRFLNTYEVQNDSGTEFHLRVLVGEDKQLVLPQNTLLRGDIPIVTQL